MGRPPKEKPVEQAIMEPVKQEKTLILYAANRTIELPISAHSVQSDSIAVEIDDATLIRAVMSEYPGLLALQEQAEQMINRRYDNLFEHYMLSKIQFEDRQKHFIELEATIKKLEQERADLRDLRSVLPEEV